MHPSHLCFSILTLTILFHCFIPRPWQWPNKPQNHLIAHGRKKKKSVGEVYKLRGAGWVGQGKRKKGSEPPSKEKCLSKTQARWYQPNSVSLHLLCIRNTAQPTGDQCESDSCCPWGHHGVAMQENRDVPFNVIWWAGVLWKEWC